MFERAQDSHEDANRGLFETERSRASHAETLMLSVDEISPNLRRPERKTSAQHRRRRYGENAEVVADNL